MKPHSNFMTGEDRRRMSRALWSGERAARLAQLRDREASLVTVVDCSKERLDRVRSEIAELEGDGR